MVEYVFNCDPNSKHNKTPKNEYVHRAQNLDYIALASTNLV